MKCADYEEQLMMKQQLADARPDIEGYSEPSEITVSKFGNFAERRVPFGHPSSAGKNSFMQSAFTNKLSESSRGTVALNGPFAENMHQSVSLPISAMTRDTRRSNAVSSQHSHSHEQDQIANRRFTSMQTKSNQLARERSQQMNGRQ